VGFCRNSIESARIAKRRLPQLDGGWFLADGGIETVLIFQDGVELPEFAAFVLLQTPDGLDTLRRYYRPARRRLRGGRSDGSCWAAAPARIIGTWQR
jgi:homocysteine S-methyltransferase